MIRRSAQVWAGWLLVAAACGDNATTPTPDSALSLSDTYDISGMAREMPDGVTPTSLVPFFLLMRGLSVSEDGSVTGTLGQKGVSETFPISGTYDAELGELRIAQLDGALTATVAEHVEELGADVHREARPNDGVANELTGFFRTKLGSRILDGTFFAVSRITDRPDPPDETKIRAVENEPGMIELSADAGAVEPERSIEVYRYRLGSRTPEQIVIKAGSTGGFRSGIVGTADDALLIRVSRAGIASDARAVVVTR